MLSFMPGPIRALLTFTLFVINIAIVFVPLIVLSILKVLLPAKLMQRLIAKALIYLAEYWVFVNSLILTLVHDINIDIEMPESLGQSGWYLVTCNHQSWVDIVVLQEIFRGKLPFLKFFLKKELMWVPFLGLAWWALDFPFMRRYSHEYLQKHPEKKGTDLEITRQACEKFKEIPVSVMNFVEGTRYSDNKRSLSGSGYQYLLNPKAGGVAFVLSAMSGQLRSLVDVTIVYHEKSIGFWDLMFGRVRNITVRVTERPIPTEMALGSYETDPEFRSQLKLWLGGIWQEKDDLIAQVKRQEE